MMQTFETVAANVRTDRSVLPSEPLRLYLDEIVIRSARRGDSSILTVAPDARASLVLCDASTSTSADRLAIGSRTRATYKQASAVPFHVRVFLLPGCVQPLFGIPLYTLVDRSISVADLWGARGVRARTDVCAAGPRIEDIVRALENVVRDILRRERDLDQVAAHVELLRRATAHLDRMGTTTNDGALASLATLPRTLGVSERTLRRLFHEEIGVSPKRYARIARLRRVLGQLGASSWAQLAAGEGFADQSHLTAEFRDLLGVTPRAFAAGRLPGSTPCQSLTKRPAP